MYVSLVHSLWKKEGRASKRYGRLIGSQQTVLNIMMKAHKDEVTEWMTERYREAAARAAEEKRENDDDDDDDDDGSDDDDEDDEDDGDDDRDRDVDDDEQSVRSPTRESDGDTIDDPGLLDAATAALRGGGVVGGGDGGLRVPSAQGSGSGSGNVFGQHTVPMSSRDTYMSMQP